MNLGEPPTKFTCGYEDKDGKLSPDKTYTPQSFWKEWVAETDLDDYVQLGNVPGQDYGKVYELSHSRDIYGAPDIRYLNMKIDVLKAAALKSVLDKQPVWFAADVMKDQDGPHGIMEVGVHDYDSIFGPSDKLDKCRALELLGQHAEPRHGPDGRRRAKRQAGQVAGGKQLGQGEGP